MLSMWTSTSSFTSVKQKACRIIPLSHGKLQFLSPFILYQTYHFTQHTILHHSTISTIQTIDYSIKVLTSKCIFYKSIWSQTLYECDTKCTGVCIMEVLYCNIRIFIIITTVTNNSSGFMSVYRYSKQATSHWCFLYL